MPLCAVEAGKGSPVTTFLPQLQQLTAFAFEAHRDHAKRPSKAVRLWDQRTPYAIHPTWCAMTLLTETSLPADLRERGAYALLLHDVPEDTDAELPDFVTDDVLALVDEMTFASSDEEMRLVWSRSKECLLLKLYDKVSNLLDGTWMDAKKRKKYKAYARKLLRVVAESFGPDLNIIRIARAVLAN